MPEQRRVIYNITRKDFTVIENDHTSWRCHSREWESRFLHALFFPLWWYWAAAERIHKRVGGFLSGEKNKEVLKEFEHKSKTVVVLVEIVLLQLCQTAVWTHLLLCLLFSAALRVRIKRNWLVWWKKGACAVTVGEPQSRSRRNLTVLSLLSWPYSAYRKPEQSSSAN